MLDKGGALARLSRRWRNHALRRADATIVIGKRMRDFVARRGVKRASIHLVANWADERAIHPVPPSANPLREEWGYANDDMVVGYSGNLGRAHDASAFVDAMRAAVQPVHEDIRFLFVGGGAGLDPVRKAAASLPPDTIAFRPYQPRDRLALSLSVPDIHWLSLRPQLEGLIVPSKFYGIAAAARPVLFIGDTNGEIAGIIREAQCGASFAPDDTHSLVEFLRYLRQSPAERASMGANARAWLDEHAAIDRQLAAWVNLVDSIHPARN
jgi:glycosyltransferase involved in cell wall biosynthesis